VARIHNVGAARPFVHRPTLEIEHFGVESYRFLLETGRIPRDLELAYRSLAEDLIGQIRACYARAGTPVHLRLHGDCHPGNILWADAGPHIVDLDDVLEGYTQFRDLDPRELHLIEALRTLRMMHYAAWLARRWEDPAFPRAFPYFDSPRYWEGHILALREQAALMNEPPLVI
jgi:Ser/Thr protein kinase RdoA (MazF antagonist)